MKALVAGLLMAGAVVGFLAWRKKAALETRGVALKAALEAGGREAEVYLLAAGAEAERHLTRYADEYARARVQQVALEQVRAQLPIDAYTINRMNALAARWGVA